MLAPCPGRQRQAAGWRKPAAAAAAICVLPGCAGPAAGALGSGAWGVLALAGAALAGFVIGSQRSRAAAERGLRQARAERRQWSALVAGGTAPAADAPWLWQTDAQHQLLSWQAPGQPPQRRCALFDAALLSAQLHTRQPFAGLRLTLPQTQDDSLGWTLRGVPGHDDLGQFNGYIGCALPTDVNRTLQTGAAAVPALLALHTAPAVVALAGPQGWQLLQANSAAQALWPQLAGDGGPDAASRASGWAAVAAALPAAVLQALQALETAAADAPVPAPAPAVVDGWQLQPFSTAAADHGAAGAVRGVVLAQQPPATPALPTEPVAGTRDDGQPGAASESDNFSFTVSHDLRAPIRVVEGFTRIVKEDYGRLLDRVGNDHLDRVLGAAARMNLMIDALLQLARLSQQPLARQPVNLSQLASYVVDDLRRAAPERDADIDIEPGLAAQGDPTLLRLVLENLLGNAWKYSGRCPRSQISLRTELHQGRPTYVVRDNGAGFDMRSADRLFGLFQRLHSASEFTGHGVGLASVRRIVRRHGGEIWAQAEPGRGAAFFFTLA